MRPLFTVHAGEYLVALEVERRFPRALLWVPARDTGVDLLVSDRRRRRTVALQVKYSKDFLPHMGAEFQKRLRPAAGGRWTATSYAGRSPTYGCSFFRGSTLPLWTAWSSRQESCGGVCAVHGAPKRLHIYLTVTETKRCFETRGVGRDDLRRIGRDQYEHRHRDLSPWLNAWARIARLNR